MSGSTTIPEESPSAPPAPDIPPAPRTGKGHRFHSVLLRLRRWGARPWFAVAVLVLSAGVTSLDLAEGPGREAGNLYDLPILLAAAAWGAPWALTCACACAGAFLLTLVVQHEPLALGDYLQAWMFPILGLTTGGLVTEYLRGRRLHEDLSLLNAGLESRIRIAVAAERGAQQKLREKERLAALGEAAARVAHEIRNPLVAVGGFTRRALRLIPAEHPASKELSVVAQESRRLEELLRDLLDFSRPPECNGHEPLCLPELLQEALDLTRERCEQSRVQVCVCGTPPADSLEVTGDREALKRAFLNLVLNAVDAMPGGGRLTVSFERSSLSNGPAASVTFRDTGSGMAPEVIEKAFDPFFTTKRGGTGIGLAVVKKTVRVHGGEVEIESSPGAGTAMKIRLPMLDRGAAEART